MKFLPKAVALLEMGYDLKIDGEGKYWFVKEGHAGFPVDGRTGWSIVRRRPDLVTLKSDEGGIKVFRYDPKPRAKRREYGV